MLGPKWSLTELVDRAITQEIDRQDTERREAPRHLKKFPLRPSASGDCARKLWYEGREWEGAANFDRRKIDPRLYRIFSFGHAVEYDAIKHLRLISKLKGFEGAKVNYTQQHVDLFVLEDGRLISGAIDGAIELPDAPPGMFDIKSVGDGFSMVANTRWDQVIQKFTELNSVNVLHRSDEKHESSVAFGIDNLRDFISEFGADDFFVNNLIQLNAYCHSDFARKRGMDQWASVFRVNKNSQKLMEVRFKPCARTFDETERKFNYVNQAIWKNEEVKRSFYLGSARCGLCPYSQTCWGQDAAKAWRDKFPKKTDPIEVTEDGVRSALKRLLELDGDAKKLYELQEKLGSYFAGLEQNRVISDGVVYETKFLKGRGRDGAYVCRRGK